jgi:two-component system LytT family response regulator
MIKAIIIDDEPAGINNLKNLLTNHCNGVKVIGTGKNIETGLALINNPSTKFDVAFLDINLPDGLVFQLIDQITDINFEIIFVTAYDNFAIRACDYSSIGYVTKPIDPDELISAVKRIPKGKRYNTKEKIEVFKGHYNPNPFKKIGISSMSEVQFVRINEIIRLEADDNMTHFWINDGRRITASKTLKHYDKLLTPFNFFKVHQSHLINLNFIKSYVRNEGGYLLMEDGRSVEISRRRRPLFLEKLRQLQESYVSQ